MKILKTLLAIAVVLVLAFFLGAYLLPDRVALERSIEIERPQIQVFSTVNDISRFNEWSPWYALDPDAEYRFEGPSSGAGSVMHWHGNEQVRSGSLRILEDQPPGQIHTEVSFGGFPVPASSEYRIEALSDVRSRITWTFATQLQGPLARWFGLLMPRYLGRDYEQGLQQLKTLLESEPVEDYGDLPVQEHDVMGTDVIAIAGAAPGHDRAAVSVELGARYGELLDYAGRHRLGLSGHPLTLTGQADADTWQFLAALPVRMSTVPPVEPGIELLRTHTGPALVLEHVGPYADLVPLRARLEAYARAHGHVRAGAVQEVYVSDPEETPEDERVTRIIYPLQQP